MWTVYLSDGHLSRQDIVLMATQAFDYKNEVYRGATEVSFNFEFLPL